MTPVFCHNKYHLGDCLITLHLLRALAKQNPDRLFVFFCQGCNIGQLREVVEDLSNISLQTFETYLWDTEGHKSIDCWKNAEEFWTRSPHQWDWSTFTLQHHEWTARRMGLNYQFRIREALLFDYSALDVTAKEFQEMGGYTYDFLIGDSAPSSGQYSEWADHSKEPMKELIERLSEKWDVLTTSRLKEEGHSISYIGRISQLCKHSIMVPNGPFFPTLNTANHHSNWGRKRIILLDNGEQLGMPFIHQCQNVGEVMQIAKHEGWL